MPLATINVSKTVLLNNVLCNIVVLASISVFFGMPRANLLVLILKSLRIEKPEYIVNIVE